MRWVTTVTWVWVALFLFWRGVIWAVSQPGVCKGETAFGCAALALTALPAFGLFLLGIPVILGLWVARFARWMTHRRDEPARIGYAAPRATSEPRPQYSITGRRIR